MCNGLSDMKAAPPANSIPSTASDAALDRLMYLAARLYTVPIALFVDAERQWSGSNEGNLPPEIFSESALYAHAILQSDVFAINDALAGERFADKPLIVSGSPIRFCAGATLRTPRWSSARYVLRYGFCSA